MTEKRVQHDETKPDLNNAPRLELQALLEKAMKERDMSIDGLREVLQTMSETARRFVRGLAVPSNSALKLMADHFGWNFEEVKAIAIRDRERIKHGELMDVAHGVDPVANKFVLSWPLLNNKQKKVLTTQLADFLKENGVGRLTNRSKANN
jgi:hypothetical protein